MPKASPRPPVPAAAPPAVDVYTMGEAARLKGVSYHTVSRAVRRGALPHQRLGRMVFLDGADLASWRPMVERAPRKYRRRQPDPAAAPTLLDLAAGERVELARRLAALLEAIHAAAREEPLEPFLALLAERLGQALELKRVAIWGIDRERGVGRRLASFGPPMSELTDEVPLPEVPAFVRFLENGEATAQDAADFGPPPAPLLGVTTLFAAPLRVGGRVLGAALGDRGGTPFALTAGQLRLAEGLANHAALALERAQLRAELAAVRERENGAGRAKRSRTRARVAAPGSGDA